MESGKAIASEIEQEKLVQKITDIATEISGAKFGAFFYNVVGKGGEKLVLYTISGVPREAFSKFPTPRNTKIFNPTFQGLGSVRYDDVTKEAHYGQNSPYSGMPNGHLPVRSYLATPVIAPGTDEVIGGLFFGHPDSGVFTVKSQTLIEGVAAQAAIAMGNARLFEEKKRAEELQKEVSSQYESIFKASSESIIIYDESGYIREANPSASRIHGYSRQELLQIHASRLFKNVEDFTALKEIAFSGRQYQGTNERIKKDGTLFKADFVGYQFMFRGKPHVLSMVRERNSSEQIQTALERSEHFAEIITNVSPTALWMTNEVGENIYVNQTWLDWTGGQLQDHLGQGWLAHVYEPDKDKTFSYFTEAFSKRKVFNQDFRIVRRSGEIRWCSTYATPFFHHDGKFGGFAGSLADVTDRKKAEEQLEAQVALINTITQNTEQALFMMDEQQHCTYMNPAAEAMTGFRCEQLNEKPLHYYIQHTYPDGRHFPIEESQMDLALSKKCQMRGEAVFIRKTGEFFPVAFVASPILINDVPHGTVVEARDITDEKQLQLKLRKQQEEAMALLEEKVKERTAELEKINDELLQFTSVASHDLKEPVRKVSIFSSRLKDISDRNSPQFDTYLDNIIRSSQRMVNLIDDLLSFSRLSHARTHFTEVNINDIIAHILYDLQLAIDEKRAEFIIDDLPKVQGVRLQLQQVFQNLIHNSLKFCAKDRTPVIKIRSYPVELNYVIIYEDNGIGFADEFAEQIFDIFERLHAKEAYDGTGIGLAIVKKIIELHGGTIKASGREDQGAVFTITLPHAHPTIA